MFNSYVSLPEGTWPSWFNQRRHWKMRVPASAILTHTQVICKELAFGLYNSKDHMFQISSISSWLHAALNHSTIAAANAQIFLHAQTASAWNWTSQSTQHLRTFMVVISLYCLNVFTLGNFCWSTGKPATLQYPLFLYKRFFIQTAAMLCPFGNKSPGILSWLSLQESSHQEFEGMMSLINSRYES
jgi:hypothetical protein